MVCQTIWLPNIIIMRKSVHWTCIKNYSHFIYVSRAPFFVCSVHSVASANCMANGALFRMFNPN